MGGSAVAEIDPTLGTRVPGQRRGINIRRGVGLCQTLPGRGAVKTRGLELERAVSQLPGKLFVRQSST